MSDSKIGDCGANKEVSNFDRVLDFVDNPDKILEDHEGFRAALQKLTMTELSQLARVNLYYLDLALNFPDLDCTKAYVADCFWHEVCGIGVVLIQVDEVGQQAFIGVVNGFSDDEMADCVQVVNTGSQMSLNQAMGYFPRVDPDLYGHLREFQLGDCYVR